MEFEQLVNTYMADMYATAMRLTRSPQVAEDLVQDLFVQIRVKNITTEHVQNPRAWLASILYRMFVDWWRRERNGPVKLFESEAQMLETMEHQVSDSPGPEQELEADDETQTIENALNRLNEDHRRILLLHDVEGYTLAELQVMLNLPLGTLKSRLHRGRERLQRELESSNMYRDVAVPRIEAGK